MFVGFACVATTPAAMMSVVLEVQVARTQFPAWGPTEEEKEEDEQGKNKIITLSLTTFSRTRKRKKKQKKRKKERKKEKEKTMTAVKSSGCDSDNECDTVTVSAVVRDSSTATVSHSYQFYWNNQQQQQQQRIYHKERTMAKHVVVSGGGSTTTTTSTTTTGLPPALESSIPTTLRQRIVCRVPSSPSTSTSTSTSPPPPPTTSKKSFILYLPTVVLRFRHNPAFALACHLANYYQVPLVVLAVVVDDDHLSHSVGTTAAATATATATTTTPVVVSTVTQTARRLAFTLEALQSCTKQWQDHGALTLVRVHGPKQRYPNHLTLVHHATSVIMDEPFVEPYRTLMRRVVKTCRRSRCRSSSSSSGEIVHGTPCYTVDGSTTVPPCMKLRPATTTKGYSNGDDNDGDVSFTIGAPTKAWRWQEQTKELRKTQIYAVCHEKAIDAPNLIHKVRGIDRTAFHDTLFHDADQINHDDENNNNNDDNSNNNNNNDNRRDSIPPHSQRSNEDLSHWPVLKECLRTMWKPNNPILSGANQQLHQPSKLDVETGGDYTSRTTTSPATNNCNNVYEAPGRRPWTVDELLAIEDCKQWAMTEWDGVDVTVRPCQQTHGSQRAALQRWKSFVQSDKIKNYAKLRNKISEPHAVSRISCYLNLGILSIFDVVQDVWRVRSSQKGYGAGAEKFLDEIIKFREGSYVHCFSTPFYHTESVLPVWSCRHLESMYRQGRRNDGFSFEHLSSALTGDEVWDAMQRYLIETGELHNNARMTWGKTVVHWQAKRFSAGEVLRQLVYLNDRYALDGLSPPSYFGILWCFGFQDKPSKASPAGQPQISTKWASQYRQGSSGFEEAMAKLYHQSNEKVLGQSKTGGNKSILDYASIRNSQNDAVEPSPKKIRRAYDSSSSSSNGSNKNRVKKGTNSIMSYFSPANK